MVLDVRADERAKGEDANAFATRLVEGGRDEDAAESCTLVFRVDLRVHERDRAGFAAILDKADDCSVRFDLEADAPGRVAHGERVCEHIVHAPDSSPSPTGCAIPGERRLDPGDEPRPRPAHARLPLLPRRRAD